MIGKCCTCPAQIDKKFQRRFCEDCMKQRLTAKYRVANQKREGRNKIQYECFVCKDSFYSHQKRQYKICNKDKCRNHFYSMSKKIQVLEQRIEKAQHKLVAAQIAYDSIAKGSVTQ